MAHNEHNRPKSGGMVLIVAGILIFIFAPSYFEKQSTISTAEGIVAIIIGFVLGGIGFYLTFLKKKKKA